MLMTMPNLAHPLFSAPVELIDSEMVRGFLALELEESFTLDYKRNVDAVSDTVAAMANSYGGIVLIGVDAHPKDKNLPGELVGVKAIDKDRLVSKMATTFDPPGWTPDVIPVTVDDRLLLVVRIDPDSVPRPLFHQGVVRVRLDGRNIPADRRLVYALFQQAADPVLAYTGDPRFLPDHRSATRFQRAAAPPDLVIRAAVSRPLRRDAARLRLHGTTVDALMRSLSAPSLTGAYELPERLHALVQRVGTHQDQQPWTIDPEHGNGRHVRLAAGHPIPGPHQAGIRLECSATLPNGGSSLDVLFDLLLWTGGKKIANDLWVQACYEAVRALIRHALPTLTLELLGTASIPTPPIELHIASGVQGDPWLENTLSTDLLGEPTGAGRLRGGSEHLNEELVAAGDLPNAVIQALRNMALDWRYLHPNFPVLHD
ncbi:helix-turn-helix domain-containing protein [Streptomyces sp. NPDC059688]|uniref:Divergent AAA domain protein n=1 Tax=Streptomyces cyanogenus TaxID=80860 RepID=A0ABX7TWP3_STRCY|nr:ATP-binding protein [Streptomyces cyanogenus]QTD99856.1 Divergent AAA domain protein [Streptomyces cyanogenus]